MARTAKQIAPDGEAEIQEQPKQKKKSPTYEKWKVDVEPKGKGAYLLSLVKVMRSDVKISPSTVDMLNSQSHNNGVRYYETGTKQGGDEETITVN